MGEGSAQESHLASLGGEEVLQAPGSSLHPPHPTVPLGLRGPPAALPLALAVPLALQGEERGSLRFVFKAGTHTPSPTTLQTGTANARGPGRQQRCRNLSRSSKGLLSSWHPPTPGPPQWGQRWPHRARDLRAPCCPRDGSRSQPLQRQTHVAGCCAPPARPAATGPGAPAAPPRRRDACSCSADRRPRGLRPGPAGKWLAWPSQSPGQLAW